MCSSKVFDTIEISSITISFKYDTAILICVLFWSDISVILSRDSLAFENYPDFKKMAYVSSAWSTGFMSRRRQIISVIFCKSASVA